MTYLEKLESLLPNATTEWICPSWLGLEHVSPCTDMLCEECWNREMPQNKTEEE